MNRQHLIKAFLLVLSCLVLGGAFNPAQANEGRVSGGQGKPNVIFVLTDDQGYGDLSCHGNPILKTPNLDRMHDESVRFTDFHVSPLCTPTRGALLTGRDPGRNGAYRTSAGRGTPDSDFANSFVITSHVGGVYKIKYPAIGRFQLNDASGEAVSYTKESQDIVNFSTKKGTRYFMTFADN